MLGRMKIQRLVKMTQMRKRMRALCLKTAMSHMTPCHCLLIILSCVTPVHDIDHDYNLSTVNCGPTINCCQNSADILLHYLYDTQSGTTLLYHTTVCSHSDTTRVTKQSSIMKYSSAKN